MAVDSVASSTSTLAGATRQTAENQQAQQAERREPKAEERKEQAPKPVVNAQGQTTGTLINVTA